MTESRGSQVLVIDAAVVHRVFRSRNSCLLIEDTAGRMLLFKRNTGGRYKLFVSETERQQRDDNNVLASHILQNRFGLSTVLYSCAKVRMPYGDIVSGVVCDYISGLLRLEGCVNPIINNVDAALRQAVMLAWFGDMDRIANNGNEGLTREGEYFSLDYDLCFQRGVACFGVPLVSLYALKHLFAGLDVSPVIAEIESFTPDDIRTFVRQSGLESIPHWSIRTEDYIVSVLLQNQRLICSSHAFKTLCGVKSWLTVNLHSFVGRYHQLIFIPRRLSMLVRKQGLWLTAYTLAINLKERKTERPQAE